jgi:hypothetical protein
MTDEIKDRLEELSSLVTGDSVTDNVHEYYKQYFKIPGNPFPPSGIADAIEETPPFRPQIENEIFDFIKRSYRDRQFHSLIIAGDYGTGKTHTLRFIEYVVNTFMNVGDRCARAIYVERPRLEANELNRTILRRLGLDTVRKYTWFALHDELLKEVEEQSEDFKELRRSLTLPKRKGNSPLSGTAKMWNEEDAPIPPAFSSLFSPATLSDYRNFLDIIEMNNWNREEMRYFLVRCLVKAVGQDISIDLAQTFVALMLSRDEKSFSSWEALVSMSKPRAESSLRAPTFLQFLLRIMHLNGIVYVYLLLDEFEEVPQGSLLSSRQRQEYLYTMREVFDKIREGLAVVIAITPPALTAFSAIATPLADRNPRRIDLPPLELQDAIKLVQFYFDRERENSSLKKVKKGDIKPFNDKILAKILNSFPTSVQKTPRNLIQFLHRLLEHSAQNNLESVNEETIESLLSEFGAMKPTHQQPSRRRK